MHPRIMLTAEREAALRRQAGTDPFLQTMLAYLRSGADWALDEPTVRYKMVGPRLRAQSRACLGKVATLSLAYRWFVDKRYARRACQNEGRGGFPGSEPDPFPRHGRNSARRSPSAMTGCTTGSLPTTAPSCAV